MYFQVKIVINSKIVKNKFTFYFLPCEFTVGGFLVQNSPADCDRSRTPFEPPSATGKRPHPKLLFSFHFFQFSSIFQVPARGFENFQVRAIGVGFRHGIAPMAEIFHRGRAINATVLETVAPMARSQFLPIWTIKLTIFFQIMSQYLSND